MTSELYDLIVELRPDNTSAGLAEHIKRKYEQFQIYTHTYLDSRAAPPGVPQATTAVPRKV